MRMTPEEMDRAVEKFIRDYPQRVAAALQAVIATDMVAHARGDHPRQPFPDGYGTKDLRQLIAKSITKRQKGRVVGDSFVMVDPASMQSGSHVGRRFFTRGGLMAAAVRAGDAKVDGAGNITCEFRCDHNKASFVEWGTKNNSNFPFMIPAVWANIGKVRERIEKAIELAVISAGLG